MALFGPGVNGLFSIPGCCMINLWDLIYYQKFLANCHSSEDPKNEKHYYK